MKKFARITALMLVVVLSLALLASCGISEKTAEKVNQAVKDGEAMSVADLKKLCGGDPTYDLRVASTGFLVWVSGCKTPEDVQKKLDDGKTPKALYVMVVVGKVTTAVFQDYDKDKK